MHSRNSFNKFASKLEEDLFDVAELSLACGSRCTSVELQYKRKNVLNFAFISGKPRLMSQERGECASNARMPRFI